MVMRLIKYLSSRLSHVLLAHYELGNTNAKALQNAVES